MPETMEYRLSANEFRVLRTAYEWEFEGRETLPPPKIATVHADGRPIADGDSIDSDSPLRQIEAEDAGADRGKMQCFEVIPDYVVVAELFQTIPEPAITASLRKLAKLGYLQQVSYEKEQDSLYWRWRRSDGHIISTHGIMRGPAVMIWVKRDGKLITDHSTAVTPNRYYSITQKGIEAVANGSEIQRDRDVPRPTSLLSAVRNLKDCCRKLRDADPGGSWTNYFTCDEERHARKRTWGDELGQAVSLGHESWAKIESAVHTPAHQQVVVALHDLRGVVSGLPDSVESRDMSAVVEQVLGQPLYNVRNLTNDEYCQMNEPKFGRKRTGREALQTVATYSPIDGQLLEDLSETARRVETQLDGPTTSKGAERAAANPALTHCFRLRGNMWEIRFGNESGNFSDMKGLQIIQRLLQRPNPHQASTALELMESDARKLHAGVPEPMLDDQAKAEIRQNIADYDNEIEQAREMGDEPKAKSLAGEKQEVIDAATAAAGFAGRTRTLGPASDPEKARKAVHASLTRAYKKFEFANPPLSNLVEHLRRNVQAEGCTFAYGPETPVDWAF